MSSESKISVGGDRLPTTSGAPEILDPSAVTAQQVRKALQAAVPFIGVMIQEACRSAASRHSPMPPCMKQSRAAGYASPAIPTTRTTDSSS